MKTRNVLVALLFASAVVAQDPVVLQGRVRNMLGEPVVAAAIAVAAAEQPDVVLARTVADGMGLFRCSVSALPVGKGWRVSAHGEGMSRAHRLAFSGRRPLQFVLHDAVALHGSVVDAKGKPAAGVPVYVRSSNRSLTDGEHCVTTDAQGRFAKLSAPVGPVVVGAFVPGVGMLRADLVATEDTQVTLVPVADAQTSIEILIEGLPDGERAPALLGLRGSGGIPRLSLPPPMRQLRLRADRLVLEGLPDWSYQLDARSSGYGMSPTFVRLEKGKGPHRLTLTVAQDTAESTTVTALVRDRGGAPVANADMQLASFGANVRLAGRTDEAGRVRFRGKLAAGSPAILYPGGDWVVDRAFRDGFSGLLAHEFVVDPERELDVRLVPACIVGGRLVLPNGKPAVFVEVKMHERAADQRGYWRPVAGATTDRDGRFRFEPQVARRQPVRLQVVGALGSVFGAAFSIDEPGTMKVERELRLSAPSDVHGVVRQQDGRPAVGVCVRLSYPAPRGAAPRAKRVEVLTDKAGRYRLQGVVPGDVEVTLVRDPRRSGPVESLQVVAGKSLEVDLAANWLGN